MGVDEYKFGKKPHQRDHGHIDKEIYDSAVSDVHRKAKKKHQTDHNYTVKQADDETTALHNGRRKLSHRGPDESAAAKKKRDNEEALFRSALKQLQDRLEELFEEIVVITERLLEIDTEIEELEYLKNLAGKGLLDPKNPDHAKLLKKYGITQEDLDSGRILLLLNEQLGFRRDERTALEKRRDELQEQAKEAIHEAQADGTITPEQVERFRERLDSFESEVSAQVRITAGTSQGLQAVAIDHFTQVMNEDISTEGLQLGTGHNGSLSFAASLDKQRNAETATSSLKERFTAMAGPSQESSQSDHVATHKALPEFNKA